MTEDRVLVERFRAAAEPVYSDVYEFSPWFETYDDAKHYGERILRVGNWPSFQVEKHFFWGPKPDD